MPRVFVTFPTLLADAIGRRQVEVMAETVGEAFTTLRREYPSVAALIFDGDGALRPHVLVFHNDTATRWMSTLDVPLRENDRLDVVQAISGG